MSVVAIQLVRYVMAIRNNFVYEDYKAEGNIFALCESGSFYLDDTVQKSVVNPEEGAYFEKGKRYLRKANTPLKLHLFRFEADEKLIFKSHITFKNKNRIFSNLELLKRLNNDIYSENFEYKAHIFNDIVNLYKFENTNLSGEKIINDEIVSMAVKTLNQDFFRNVELTSFAEKYKISYVQFLRRFKAETGMTPFEYTARLKIKRAEYLLVNTDLAIKDISPVCGFENEYYFSNFFKKRKGCSPSKYRAEFSIM